MRHFRGVVVIALALTLVGCASPDDEKGRAAVDAALEVEQVPGVLFAPYAHFVQIDPTAPEDEIVTTAMAVRDFVDGIDPNRPRELDIVAVFPGDPYVNTQFSASSYDDPDRFEQGVRLWAGLLDDGFSEVSYVTPSDGDGGDGTLAVTSEDPDGAEMTLAEAYDTADAALSEAFDTGPRPKLYVSVDRSSISDESGFMVRPDAWIALSDDLIGLEYLRSSSVRITPDATWVSLYGATALTAEQTAQIMAALSGRGVLQPGVNVIYNDGPALPKDSKTVLFGAAQ